MACTGQETSRRRSAPSSAQVGLAACSLGAVAAAPKTYSGTAASVINTARMVGATAGVALLGGLFAAHIRHEPSAATAVIAGLHPALLGGALVEALGAVVAFAAIPAKALAGAKGGALNASSE